MNDKTELKIEVRSEYLWITLPDAITMYDNKEIEQKIGKQLRDQKDHVVLDFSYTHAVYSSGLGLMIRIRRFVTERGGILSLVNVSEDIYEMFTALNIDKVFNIYATDVEFEISQDDFLKSSDPDKSIGFLCVGKQETDCFYITLSGEMTASFDLSTCDAILPMPGVSLYLFDLSTLEMVDGAGAEVLFTLAGRIHASGGECRVYGASEVKREMLTLLGADTYLTYYPDEKSAYNGTDPQM